MPSSIPCFVEQKLTSNSSKIALSLLERIGIDACRIDVVAGSAVEQFLQNYSGWQYFPQLYVCAEFVGGNTIIPEFFRSGEYLRILARGKINTGSIVPPREAPADLSKSIWKISLSPNKDRLVIARADGTIEILQADSRKALNQMLSHDGWVNTARFDAAGTIIYSGGSDTLLREWRLSETTSPNPVPAHDRWINDIAIDPTSNSLVSVGADRLIRLWDKHLTPISESKAHGATIWCALAVNDAYVTGDEDGFVTVSDARTLVTRSHFRAHQNCITSISPGPGPSTYCTTGYDGMVVCWNLDGEVLFTYAGHAERVWCACPIDDTHIMASSCADGSVKLWDFRDGAQVHALQCLAPPLAMCYLPREKTLIVGLSTGELIWEKIQ